MARAFLFLVLTCLTYSVSASSAESQKLVVASLNAEWLWTPHDGKVDGARFNRGDPSVESYKAELSFYKKILIAYDVDIVALSEIENEQVVQEFVAFLNKDLQIQTQQDGQVPWGYAFAQGRDTATGQDVALLARGGVLNDVTSFGFPAGSVIGYGKPKRLSKVVGAKLALISDYGVEEIGFATSHFLSKRKDNDKKSAKRLMQARALVKAIDTYSDLDAVIVAGDFNDYRHSPVIKTLESVGLKNVQDACFVSELSENQMRYKVDHILFRGLECASLSFVDMKEFSDHPMVIAWFNLGK